ncbi:MAG: S8 family serine peptidase [candidate division Zixibacteria bacterium]|nr:S8 family serine peptidase [candidate division Zixibacteria bacterium]
MKTKLFLVALSILLIASVSYANYLEEGTDYVPNRIVVNFHPLFNDISIDKSSGIVNTGIEKLDALNQKYVAYDMYRLFPGDNSEEMKYFYVIKFDIEPELETTLNDYSGLDIVEHVEPVGLHPIYDTPNDPSYGTQWHLPKVEAPSAWDIEKGDPDIVIGIPDTGVDYDHPDLADHMWINDAEDINNNGIFDSGDINNIDDDGNGYIDDVIGYDWVDNASWCTDNDCDNPDNDPMDYHGHGTHCSGIAAAVTDNGTGVAGLDWNGTVMCLRIGYASWFGGTVQMDAAASAINYARNKGVKVISCSWGNSNSGGLGTAVTNFINSGGVLLVAAGNNNDQNASYLAGRSDCVAVAATDRTDHKASFSSYGTWVDVCAPGVDIYSTVFNNSYTYMDGTSMSTPLAAGLVGLIFSQNPGFSSLQARQQLYDSCDDIDGINPSYAGKLGHGRINAYEALVGGGYPDVDILMTAHNPICQQGGYFTFTGEITNNEANSNVVDVWTMVRLPGGGLFGPALEFYNLNLSAYQHIQVDTVRQDVPYYAPTGQYTYVSYCGDYPNDKYDSSYFAFVVTTAVDGGGADSWAVYGWGDQTPGIPAEYSLSDNYPNPFNSSTAINFSLPNESYVKLDVYNLQGQKIETLVDGQLNGGNHTINWDAGKYSTGVYFYKLDAGDFSQTKRMTLLK